MSSGKPASISKQQLANRVAGQSPVRSSPSKKSNEATAYSHQPKAQGVAPKAPILDENDKPKTRERRFRPGTAAMIRARALQNKRGLLLARQPHKDMLLMIANELEPHMNITIGSNTAAMIQNSAETYASELAEFSNDVAAHGHRVGVTAYDVALSLSQGRDKLSQRLFHKLQAPKHEPPKEPKTAKALERARKRKESAEEDQKEYEMHLPDIQAAEAKEEEKHKAKEQKAREREEKKRLAAEEKKASRSESTKKSASKKKRVVHEEGAMDESADSTPFPKKANKKRRKEAENGEDDESQTKKSKKSKSSKKSNPSTRKDKDVTPVEEPEDVPVVSHPDDEQVEDPEGEAAIVSEDLESNGDDENHEEEEEDPDLSLSQKRPGFFSRLLGNN